MAGGKLQGLPTQEEMESAARRRAGPLVGISPLVRSGEGKETSSLLVIIAALESGLAERPAKRGRQFDTNLLRRAAEVLHAAGVPPTSGEKGRGPAVISEALCVPRDTARNIARRLAALMPAKDKTAVHTRSRSRT